jgi:hypothetical protein
MDYKRIKKDLPGDEMHKSEESMKLLADVSRYVIQHTENTELKNLLIKVEDKLEEIGHT